MLRISVNTVIIYLLLMSYTQADDCPTAGEIRDKKISRSYDWAVTENTTLKALLSVEELYAVRIMDYDAYVSCRYTAVEWPVTLDGNPLKSTCKIVPDAGEWTGTDSGELVCREKDVTKCGFKMECREPENP
jgi:hypothetical protein